MYDHFIIAIVYNSGRSTDGSIISLADIGYFGSDSHSMPCDQGGD